MKKRLLAATLAAAMLLQPIAASAVSWKELTAHYAAGNSGPLEGTTMTQDGDITTVTGGTVEFDYENDEHLNVSGTYVFNGVTVGYLLAAADDPNEHIVVILNKDSVVTHADLGAHTGSSIHMENNGKIDTLQFHGADGSAVSVSSTGQIGDLTAELYGDTRLTGSAAANNVGIYIDAPAELSVEDLKSVIRTAGISGTQQYTVQTYIPSTEGDSTHTTLTYEIEETADSYSIYQLTYAANGEDSTRTLVGTMPKPAQQDAPQETDHERMQRLDEERRQREGVNGVTTSIFWNNQMYLGHSTYNGRVYYKGNLEYTRQRVFAIEGGINYVLRINELNPSLADIEMHLGQNILDVCKRAEILYITLADKNGNALAEFAVADLLRARADYGLTEDELLCVRADPEAAVEMVTAEGEHQPLEAKLEKEEPDVDLLPAVPSQEEILELQQQETSVGALNKRKAEVVQREQKSIELISRTLTEGAQLVVELENTLMQLEEEYAKTHQNIRDAWQGRALELISHYEGKPILNGYVIHAPYDCNELYFFVKHMRENGASEEDLAVLQAVLETYYVQERLMIQLSGTEDALEAARLAETERLRKAEEDALKAKLESMTEEERKAYDFSEQRKLVDGLFEYMQVDMGFKYLGAEFSLESFRDPMLQNHTRERIASFKTSNPHLAESLENLLTEVQKFYAMEDELRMSLMTPEERSAYLLAKTERAVNEGYDYLKHILGVDMRAMTPEELNAWYDSATLDEEQERAFLEYSSNLATLLRLQLTNKDYIAKKNQVDAEAQRIAEEAAKAAELARQQALAETEQQPESEPEPENPQLTMRDLLRAGVLPLPAGSSRSGTDGAAIALTPFSVEASAGGAEIPASDLTLSPVSGMTAAQADALQAAYDEVRNAGSVENFIRKLDVESAVNRALSGTNPAVGETKASLVTVLGGKADVSDLSVHSLFEMNASGKTAEQAAAGGSVRITFSVPSLRAGDVAVVLQNNGSAWEVAPSTVSGGKVTATFNSL